MFSSNHDSSGEERDDHNIPAGFDYLDSSGHCWVTRWFDSDGFNVRTAEFDGSGQLRSLDFYDDLKADSSSTKEFMARKDYYVQSKELANVYMEDFPESWSAKSFKVFELQHVAEHLCEELVKK